MIPLPPRKRNPRYIVASFTIELEQHKWLTIEAIRLTTQTQTRVSMSDIVRGVIASMMDQSKVNTDVHPNTK